MSKLRLAVDDLRVDAFETAPAPAARAFESVGATCDDIETCAGGYTCEGGDGR